MTENPDVPIGDNDSAESLIRHLTEEIERLRDQLQANNDRIEELEKLADTDPLAPTMNRRAFVRELRRTAAYIERYGGEAWVMYLDLDGMKAINDRLGHAAGDQALRIVADILLINVRSSDIIGRLGGDEFGVILHHTGEKTAEAKAALLVSEVSSQTVAAGDQTVALSVSCGIAPIKPDMDVTDILKSADNAMYQVKDERP